MGWWGSPGCGCCDACDDCLGYEQTFDGTGALSGVSWSSAGTVTRNSGVVEFKGSSPAASISNDTVGARLTGHVRTTFEFQFTYDADVACQVLVEFATAADRLYILKRDAIIVFEVGATVVEINRATIDLALSTWYIFELCVDPTNEYVNVGVQNAAFIQDSYINDGLDVVTITAKMQGTWVPPIPPSTPGFEDFPTDVIFKVDNFKQYDREDEDPNCCPCEPFEGFIVGDPLALGCYCEDGGDQISVSLDNMANDDWTCCTNINTTWVIDYIYSYMAGPSFRYPTLPNQSHACFYAAVFDCAGAFTICCSETLSVYDIDWVWVTVDIFGWSSFGTLKGHVGVNVYFFSSTGVVPYKLEFDLPMTYPTDTRTCSGWSALDIPFSRAVLPSGIAEPCDSSSVTCELTAV